MSFNNIYVLREHAHNSFLASRATAAQMRRNIETIISDRGSVNIDFSDVGITQSFADELVGVLAYIYGPTVFGKINFKNCTNEHKAILNFVVSHRLTTRIDLPRPASHLAPH